MPTHKPSRTPCPLCGDAKTAQLFEKEFKNRTWHLSQCETCGIHFTDPQPTVDDMRLFYEGDYHAQLRQPEVAERIHGRKFLGYREWMLRYLGPGRSLDIGCATGLFVRLLKDAGFQAEGIEANSLSAEWGSRHYEVPIRQGLFDPSTSAEANFDLVTMCDVLEHTPHPLDYLRSLRGVINPGGHVFVTFPDIESIESRYFLFLSTALRRNWLWRNCHVPLHTWEFTPTTAERMFTQAGFEMVAFSRQTESASFGGAMAIFDLPTKLLAIPAVGGRFGTQMRFLLRKPA